MNALNRLGLRLFLVVAVAIVAITVAYDYVRFQRERHRGVTQLEREVGLVARATEAPLQFWLQTGSRGELERLLRDIREAKGALCVGVYDLSGRLDVTSGAEVEGGGGATNCPPALEGESAVETILGRWSALGTFRIVAPLTRDGDRIATLKVVLPATVITDPLHRQRDVIAVERGLVLAAIGIALWLAIAALVSRPTRRLMRGVEEVARGNLEARIDVKARTELGDLARAFNRMAESLREAQERQRAEAERRYALERQVRHADKLAAIGQLASKLAHEIGTPLNVISGRARVLRREFPDGDARAENLEIIRSQVDRISRDISRFLTAARPPVMRREKIDPAPIVREMAAFVEPELRKKEVRLVVSIAPDLPAVEADPDGFSQVLLNLLMNATAAVPAGGWIRVTAAAARGPQGDGHGDTIGGTPGAEGIELCITDSGPGIVPEILPRVFDAFFSTKQGEGTGLGLSICRDIIRDHRGRIAVESPPGEGATVRIWLPATSREATDEHSAHSHH